ncbi:MAG: Rpn family recombination-promoting nuclease/putative transposase [Archangium sp.]|nr:Rpn family recombination-promoting nuclease/putative transposase [Archangium sp.]
MLDAWFAEPGVAGAFVRAFLPPGAAKLVVGEPELVPGSWVDDGLRGHLSDQLMRLKLRGRELEVLCLLEAKRTNDRFVLAQVLRYMAQLYTQLSRAKPMPKRLPGVVAFVLYNGERKWTGPTRFSQLIDVPDELSPYTIEFRVMLIDLRALSVERLARDTHLAGGLLALKAATAYENEKEALILEVVSRLRRERPSTTKTFISYFRRIAPRSARRALEAALHRLEGESMKTIDDVVFDRGHRKGLKKGLEKGREEGREEGREGLRRALRSMLAVRFDKKITARILARLDRADTSMLDRWIKKAARARTLDAVFS